MVQAVEDNISFEDYWEQKKEAFKKVGWGKGTARDFWQGLTKPVFNYEVSLRATLTREEADLTYKFLKAHPDTKHYVTKGQFGFTFVNYFAGVDVHRTFTSSELNKMLKAMEWPFIQLQGEYNTEQALDLRQKLHGWFELIQEEYAKLSKNERL